MSIFAELKDGIVTTSPEQTEALGARLLAELPEEAYLALRGDLGVGKTTFVRGLARALGIDKHITSPTFNIYTLYRGTRHLLHMDAYRLSGTRDAEDLTLEEFLHPPFVAVVEWPDNIRDWFPPETFWLDFSILEPGKHQVRLVG
ncbi:MAG: tRNA (adenosine(37)-N6)-threonylcarbamoyltransferase complex ATPase subunit type 1 TsaE [Verrucomicrobiota bacterium JB022]|nr:tRNA (adenosine(37)-N6)-threonylcarbamoyltransferase complex ATPase subunit type 1 TsaE [Verrucomicrobiota bacterium JB022]